MASNDFERTDRFYAANSLLTWRLISGKCVQCTSHIISEISLQMQLACNCFGSDHKCREGGGRGMIVCVRVPFVWNKKKRIVLPERNNNKRLYASVYGISIHSQQQTRQHTNKKKSRWWKKKKIIGLGIFSHGNCTNPLFSQRTQID